MSKTTPTLTLGKEKTKVDLSRTKQAALIFRALNNPLRQKIIKLIDSKQTTDVSSLYKKLRIEQSVASQHLAILRRAAIVVTKRDGKSIHYSLNHPQIANVVKVVDDMLG